MLQVVSRGYKDHLGRVVNGNMPISNQGDVGTYSLDYVVDFGFNVSYNLSVSTSAGSQVVVLNGAMWSDFGFTSGDTVVFDNLINATGDASFNGSGTIQIVDGNKLIRGGAFATSEMYVSGRIFVNKSPEAVKVFFNLISREQQSGIDSLIDGTTPTLSNNDISQLSVGNTLPLFLGNEKSGHGIISGEIKRLSNVGIARSYRLTINFVNWLYLSRFYDLFESNDCSTPFVKASFLPLWNNPAVELSSDFKLDNDGNSGFRDENFNGNIDNFKVESISWKDMDGNSIQGMDSAKPSVFEVEVSNVAGLGFGSKVGVILFNDIDTEEKYSSNQENNQIYDFQNLKHLNHTLFTETSDIIVNGAPLAFSSYVGLNGESISVLADAKLVGGNLVIKGTVTPNSGFTTKFDDDEPDNRFVLLVRVESSSFPATNYSDTVNKLVWVGEVEDYPPVLGNYYTDSGFFNHVNSPI